MSRPAQDRPHLRGTPCAEQPPAVHDRHTAGQQEGVLQPVLRQHDRRPQLPVDFPQRRQKVCRCNGIKLTGRFVQNEHTGLHRHDRRQIQELLLPAGQLRDVLVEPGLNAEKGGHLSHPAPDGRRVIPQALQAKGEFVSSADMALAGITSRIPPDQVIDAMKEVGESMHVSLRETGEGGVANTPEARKIKEKLGM